MAGNNATILIPDISGFTEFMTKTELSHGSHAINVLIDAIVAAVGEAYEVSEIEGDAVLLIKKETAPSLKEIQETCLKIFNGFHLQRKAMQQYAICPCGACKAISHLTLKFIVHHGPLAEIKVGRFVKHSGTEMIVAHRLLKNSIDNNEYLLLSEKLLQNAIDIPGDNEMHWIHSSEEYASIGKIDFQFALLNEARKNIPDPPAPQEYYTDDTPYRETQIAANYLDVYAVLMDIPNRPAWFTNLKKVEQDAPFVFVGSMHHCTYEDYKAVVSPLRMIFAEDIITYAESCTIDEMGIALIHEYMFNNEGEKLCRFATRFMNAGDAPLPEALNIRLLNRLERMAETLKSYCEK